MNKKATLALVIAAPGALATMPLCSGGDEDFLPDISVSDDGTTCKELWEFYTYIFSTANPEMGSNKLTYNKCSASLGAALEDSSNIDFWLITDLMLAPTCCASGVSACDALVEPNMCAKSEDYQANMVITVGDADDGEQLVETCADINKIAAFTAAGFKYDLLKEHEQTNGPNGEKGKHMSRIFHWNKETCTNKDTEDFLFSKKFGKMVGYGALFGCCGASGDDACYSYMGMLWKCKLEFLRTNNLSDACEEFYASHEDKVGVYVSQDDEVGAVYVPECLQDCENECETTDDDPCHMDCDTSDACTFLDLHCPDDTYSFCSSTTRRQLAKEGPVKVKTGASGGPNTWSTTKARKMEKFEEEAKQFIRNLSQVKSEAKAAHARTIKKVAANKVGELEAARTAAKEAMEAHTG